jgi:hypothetical protein
MESQKDSVINNFSLLREMLEFPDENSFYFLQILKRRKDNPDLGKDMVHINDHYIWSLDQFDRMEDLIINQCQSENARAYFRLNRRDSKKIAFQVMKRLADYISSENFNGVRNIYASCSGEFCGDSNKKWIVDIDWKDWKNKAEISALVIPYLEELQEETGREPFSKIIPTKNGFHIITRPFNLSKLKIRYPNIDVHKDNPTILYCP